MPASSAGKQPIGSQKTQGWNPGCNPGLIRPSATCEDDSFPPNKTVGAFNMDGLKKGVLKMAMPADRKLQQIAVEDIGKFVGIVVNERENMFGKRINISGDELTGDEAAAVLSRVTGKDILYEGFSPDFLREQSEDLAIMYDWFISDGYTADPKSLKTYGLMGFEEWASKQDWSELG